MTRDDVIRMAREADLWMTSDERIAAVARFAALVAAAERERAQKIIDGMKPEIQTMLEKTYMEGALTGAKAEREACAELCESYAEKWANDGNTKAGAGADCCAQGIRARREV
jgi:hypothetical protein